ncbi:D-alanyl-D-alanine carboxypeptidase/D-alanyl-D-alanine-endopeptidase [Streptomyces sp. NPDC059740]|uniref:D-alanyl-D-alanine carboxypeptidase/D-alanyl-D-alanine endopeptidase n=1 Tax=Streptomyces sp. NPDC059740 TaxID=3346926 RepID=UPI00365C7404
MLWWASLARERRTTWRLAAVSAVLGLALAVLVVTAAGPWEDGQRSAERAWAAEAGAPAAGGSSDDRPPRQTPRAPAVLAPLGAPVGGKEAREAGQVVPPPTRAGLADALSALAKDPALGKLRSASVLDVATGEEVYGSHQGDTTAPASTIKIGTAVAALSRLGPDHRITTKVVDATPGAKKKGKRAGPRRLVLVGGGDPTLTARPARGDEQPASLRTLAAEAARTLRQAGVSHVSLDYDTSLYSGPTDHPISPNDNISPVTPLMADEGRLNHTDHGPAPRDTDPAATAARTFAGFLRKDHITVDGTPRNRKAPAGASDLATVQSPPLSAIVERMETNSDNDIAEALARQTALAAHQPASFAGGRKAVRATLDGLRLPTRGALFEDGSGLNRDDRVSAALLSHLLLLATSPDHPELRPVVTGLPVAGFSGTLSTRYAAGGPAAAGTGAVRAKTGTLTGVNTLAGTVVDADGRLLVFAFMTRDTTDALGAEQSLDRLAASLANCGCR